MNSSSPTLEDQIKTLQKHFGGIVVTVKALKACVDRLESKVDEKQNEEIRVIVEAQKKVDKSIEANAEAIKVLDEELKRRASEGDGVVSQKDMEDSKVNSGLEQNKGRVCRYHNGGFCKFKRKCRFFHSHDICKTHMETEHCKDKECRARHPKLCKWTKTQQG